MSREMDGRTSAQWTSWLTARRLRIHGLILGTCLWMSCAWIFSGTGLIGRNGVVKGADFLHYYTLGSLAREHRGADLYDMAAQSALSQQRVPQAGRIFFVPLYGPQVSLFFAPLSALPYAWALLLWELLNGTIYGVCCYAVWRTCPNLRSEGLTVLLLALSYPALFHLIAWGQTSAIALACLTVAYFELRAQRFFSAGLAIGCLAFKPQLGLAAAFVFLLSREWKVVVGAVGAALAQLSVGWFYYGTPVMRDYLQHLIRVREVFSQLEPRPYQMHSLRPFWAMAVPWPGVAFGLYVVTASAVLVVTWLCWKSYAPLGLRFSGLLLATVLVSPHLTVYDLVILAPAFLLLADWAVASGTHPKGRVGLLLYFCYALPLAGPLSIWTHLQLTVPAMAALLWTLFRAVEGEARAGSLQSADAI
ncbi:MAG: glycosyltransferase family 87 protein [Terriglobales bacterium]